MSKTYTYKIVKNSKWELTQTITGGTKEQIERAAKRNDPGSVFIRNNDGTWQKVTGEIE
jgi:hypothetical protein